MTHDEWATRFVDTRAAKVELLDRQLIGFPIVFNALSQDLGGFKERILPEAVDRTLRTGKNVDALVDHRRETSTILGSTDSGLLRMKKQSRGLYVTIDPPDTTAVRDLFKVVRAKLAKGMSFRFMIFADGQSWDEEDGILVRTIHDMEFSEVSVVVNPAYEDTEVSARSRGVDARALAEYRASRRPSLSFLDRQSHLRSRL